MYFRIVYSARIPPMSSVEKPTTIAYEFVGSVKMSSLLKHKNAYYLTICCGRSCGVKGRHTQKELSVSASTTKGPTPTPLVLVVHTLSFFPHDEEEKYIFQYQKEVFNPRRPPPLSG